MTVSLISLFQNAREFADRFYRQFYRLTINGLYDFIPVLGEGDSTDGEWTWNRLNAHFPRHVHKCAHGGPVYGSVDVPERWRNMSAAWNQLLDHVPECDALIYVDSDLTWQPETMTRLLGHLDKVPVVAAMNMRGEQFYDIWGFIAQGRNFSGVYPYHPMLQRPSPTGLYEMERAGSCMAMRYEVARTCRFTHPEVAFRGWSQDIRDHGYTIWLDPTLRVHHP